MFQMNRLLIHALILFAAGASLAFAAVPAAIPFPAALDAAEIRVGRTDSILRDALIIGNGDINGLVFAPGGKVQVMLTKNDVWDARLDTALDMPLPTLEQIKKLGGPPPRTKKGKDSYYAHNYPCPRACGKVVFATPPKVPDQARLDIRRAVAVVGDPAGENSTAEIRALAGRNVFLFRTTQPGHLEAVVSGEIPPAQQGETDGVLWLTQKIPGDPDWPGLTFTVALARAGDISAAAIVTSREAPDPQAAAIKLARGTVAAEASALVREHEAVWDKFWSASGLVMDDPLLQETWYRNLYFLRCVSKPGVISPALYAGLVNDHPKWHGDFHSNYNIQQTFQSAFGANHPDLAEPYDRLITEYLPRARWLARKVFSMDGAYFPHILYAYEPPDPAQCKSPNGRQYLHDTWGFSIGVAGFTVQPLWWHYKYQPDRRLLEDIAYPAVRDVAVFQSEFIDQCAGGETVTLAPSVSPEHWGWTKDFERNRNSTFDLAMFRYIFNAALEGATVLGRDPALVKRWQASLRRLPPYPTTKDAPPIVVDVQDAPPMVYNFAVPAAPVFPCDVVTWWSPPAEQELFRRTIGQVRDVGIDAPLMLAIGRARLSMPGAHDWLRRQIPTRQPGNGTLTTAPGVRHVDSYGHYTQQFGFSMAVGELLLQSVGDIIRVFPAWPTNRPAEFRDLRAQGGFLVSARQLAGKIQHLEITSTAGGPLQLLLPWADVEIHRQNEILKPLKPDTRGVLRLETQPGQRYRFLPAR